MTYGARIVLILFQREFDRLARTCKQEGVELPTRRELKKKADQMRELEKQPLTDKDISAMLERKKQISNSVDPQALRMARSKLNQQRSLALKRQDQKEVAELDDELAKVQAQIDFIGADHVVGTQMDEKLRKVNERNRKANVEAVRRAEIAEAERKRKERELAAKAAAQGGVAAGAAVAMKYDPSARLKTVPRMFNAATPTTRCVVFSITLSACVALSLVLIVSARIQACYTGPRRVKGGHTWSGHQTGYPCEWCCSWYPS